MKNMFITTTILGLCAVVLTTGIAHAAQPATAERKLPITGDLLILPVDKRPNAGKTADSGMLEVWVDGALIHRAFATHPRNVADAQFWAFLDMKEYKGKEATLRVNDNKLTPERGAKILSRIESSDKMRHTQPIYKEGGRPQFHFSQIHGWNNDPNGMFYSDGLYHLSWQCNPLETFFGGWYWGHAVSEDLVHWREAPRTLRSKGGNEKNRYPGMVSGQAYSGGAAVDFNNTLGKQVGDQKTIVATYTDSPFGEGIAYSTDGGFRYTVMNDINPIIVHPKPEGSKWNGSYGRDPKIIWHEPSKSWVIVAYRMGTIPDACSGHMAFYTSKDLKTWDFQSMTEKYFPEERQPNGDSDYHECPELLELPVDPPSSKDYGVASGNKTNKKWVLLDATPKYQVGSFDGKTFTPDKKEYRRGIYGGMKAAQCFSDAPDGRAICMIWVTQSYGDKVPFACGFTLPLELTLHTADDGIRLHANPVKELEQLREKELFSAQGKKIGSAETVEFDTQEQLVEVVASVKTDAKTGSIVMKVGDRTLSYALDTKKLDGVVVHDKEEGRIDFRIYIDRATIEVFAGHGSVYTINGRKIAAPAGKISISANGAEGTADLKVYKLKSIWPDNVDTLTYSNKKYRRWH